MGKEIVLNMGDLRRLIKESSKNEFKPVLGSNVEKDNKSNNDKTYKETETKIKNFEVDGIHLGDNIKYVLDNLPYLIQDYLRELSEEYDGLECIIDGIDNLIERNKECSDPYLGIDAQLALFINDNLDLFDDYI